MSSHPTGQAETGTKQLVDLPGVPGEVIQPTAPDAYTALPSPLPEAGSEKLPVIAGSPSQASAAAYLLGSFKLSIDDILLERIPAGNSGALLRYLIHSRRRSVPREELMELFWPEADPDCARNRLNVVMSKLRKSLRLTTQHEIIVSDADRYLLNPDVSWWVDVDEFELILAGASRLDQTGSPAQAIKQLEIAVNLYQGDYLQEHPFEEWAILVRERVRLAYLDALYRLSRHYFEQKQYAACASLCQAVLERDNCREDVHCLLMRCYARQGQYHLGLRQYQHCVETLGKELNVPPAASTVALYERLRQREITRPLSMA